MYSFDEKCLELATYFLQDEPLIDSPEERRELAQSIQDKVEDYIHGAKWRKREATAASRQNSPQ